MPRYKLGKLPHTKLDRLLSRLGSSQRDDVVLGPRIGEDAAAFDPGGRQVVVATDPVTFAADRIGWYAVHVNANDVATMGARPRWFQACVLLPTQSPVSVERIFDDMAEACESLDAAVIGGHTEVTAGLPNPIVIGTMLGTADGELIATGGAKPGDRLVMTKTAAVEATAIIAREKSDSLIGRCPRRTLAEAARFLFDPGISVVREGLIAADAGASAMHDPTEGGIITGLWEMAQAAGTRFVIDPGAVPVHPHTAALCRLTGLDPLRSIASGSLLIAIDGDRADGLIWRLDRAGIAATAIGRVESGSAELRSMAGKRIRHSATDEITKLYG